MTEKPVVVFGRKLPEAVEARLARDYRPKFNSEDRVYTTEVLLNLCADADAMMPCHTEHLSAEVIARLPVSLRIVANYSVGVDHVDLAAAKKRGIVVTNTPDELSDATAEIAMLCMLGARGFDMKIHYHNRRPVARDLEQGAVYHERLEDLLPHCDVLSLHSPGDPGHGRPAQRRAHRAPAGRGHRGQHRARGDRRRACPDRRPALGKARRGRP